MIYEDLTDAQLEYTEGALYDKIEKAAAIGDVLNFQDAYSERELIQAIQRLRRAMEDIVRARDQLSKPRLKLSREMADEIGTFLVKYGAKVSFGSGWHIVYKGFGMTIDRADNKYVSLLEASFPGMSDELKELNRV